MNYGAVIVETRNLENLNRTIYAHTKFLPKDWGLTCFCSEENKAFMPEGSNVIVLPNQMSEYEYNKLLTSLWFWEQIPYEKCLIFQHDSEIFRPWDSKFEQFDYIGAPWTFQRHGGNGGLSWRSVDAMKWCISQTPWMPYHGNEDVYFSNLLNISDKYKLADRQTCSEFSCETIYQPGTFGAHAIDKYLTSEQCKKLRHDSFARTLI